ncbi:hypothetical protein [Nonomuraea salmonea]|uniref:hypothetical protein n=1 Tax=Nonomuraea salmonea TaxID=46181 RepID=UPI002FEDC1AE
MTDSRPKTLLAMGADTAARLITGPVRDRLLAVADIDPGLIATDFADPAVAPPRWPRPRCCSRAGGARRSRPTC